MNVKPENRCPGSGKEVMLAWPPDNKRDAQNRPGRYRGGLLCPICDRGFEAVSGSVRKAVSQAGFEGQSGRVPVHVRGPR